MIREEPSAWRPMAEYPWRDYRDEAGKYHMVEGPRVDLKMGNGRAVTAQYRGERVKSGGEGWAFWTDKFKAYGTAQPRAWRYAKPRTP